MRDVLSWRPLHRSSIGLEWDDGLSEMGTLPGRVSQQNWYCDVYEALNAITEKKYKFQ